jgi:hypothetical protein
MIHLKLFEMNMIKRTKQQWLELIQAQQISGLSIPSSTNVAWLAKLIGQFA